jgi:voltage-gated potassium channel
MQKQIQSLTGHVIVCGVGSTGRNVIREMVATRTPCVAIDNDEGRLETLLAELVPAVVPYIVGDATEESVLQEAGITRAAVLVSALANDAAGASNPVH